MTKLKLLTSLAQYDKAFTSLVQYDKDLFKFGQQQLVMVNYVCGVNQSETGKYF